MTTTGERARRRTDWKIEDQATRVRMNQAEDDLDSIDERIQGLVTALEGERVARQAGFKEVGRTNNRLLWAVVMLALTIASSAITFALTGGG